MTLAELDRLVKSRIRVSQIKAREKATFDYILADLITRGVGSMFSSSISYPELSDAYPSLFKEEELRQRKQEQQAELSALRFKHFAESYNKKFKEVAKEVE